MKRQSRPSGSAQRRQERRYLLSQMQAAAKRVGVTADAKLRWLLSFAECDLHTLDRYKRNELAFDLFWFIGSDVRMVYRVRGSDKHKFVNMAEEALSGEDTEEYYESLLPDSLVRGIIDGYEKLPTARDIGAMQRLISKRLKSLAAVRFTNVWANRVLLRAFASPDHIKGTFSLWADSRVDCFAVCSVKLLAAYAGGIRRCPGCSLLFLAGRNNQQYCSINCQSRTNMRRHRGTPPERFGRRGRPKKETGRVLKAGKVRGRKG